MITRQMENQYHSKNVENIVTEDKERCLFSDKLNEKKQEKLKLKTSNNSVLLSSVEMQLMSEVSQTYKETGTLSDELLSALQFVYESPLLSALELADNRAVTRLECPSKRLLYHVIGSSGLTYTCFPNNKYCSCPAYKYSVLLKDENIMCKHVLALCLSEAMGVTKIRTISDKEMIGAILQVE